jgi:hypothetical protein
MSSRVITKHKKAPLFGEQGDEKTKNILSI